MKTIFGDLASVAGGKNDLFYLAEQVALSSGVRPHLYQWCGTEDPFYSSNVNFRLHAKKIGLDMTYEEGPGGHNFNAWDRQIQRVLEWLPLCGKS